MNILLSSKHISFVETYAILANVELLSSNSYANFKDIYYKVDDVLPMGMSSSGILADI